MDARENPPDQLFAVYVGGLVPGCHVELHDVRFVIGPTIEACFDDLRAQWWGSPESLHLDAWGAVHWADGHGVEITDVPPAAGAPRLWLANLGGYDPAQFTELHENYFVVAADARQAKKRALANIEYWISPHKDAVLEIETIVDIAGAASRPGRHVRLIPRAPERPFVFEARYWPIGARPA